MTGYATMPNFGGNDVLRRCRLAETACGLDGFKRDWRDRRRHFAAPGISRDNIRHLEELPTSVGPTEGGGDRPLRARGIAQLVVVDVGIRLSETL